MSQHGLRECHQLEDSFKHLLVLTLKLTELCVPHQTTSISPQEWMVMRISMKTLSWRVSHITTSKNNLNKNGSQSLSSQLSPFHHVTETMVLMARTAIEKYATALMDLWMVQVELPALEKSQRISLTIKLMPRLEDHSKQLVMLRLPPPKQPQLTHGQHPRPSSKLKKLRRRMIRRMEKMKKTKFHQTKPRKFQFFKLSQEECTPPTLEENE